MTSQLHPIIILGPQQHRTCTCQHPQCFNNDHGNCLKCGYKPRPYTLTASTRLIADTISRIITRP